MRWKKTMPMAGIPALCALALGAATLIQANSLWAAGINADSQTKKFNGYRAFVVKPDKETREYDKAAHAELLRLGMDVAYGEPAILSRPEELAQYDIVVTNVKRQFTTEQVAGIKAYLAQGGALYGSWGGPLECPELLEACGVKNARLEYGTKEIAIAEPLSKGLGECRLPLPTWVGDAKWSKYFGFFDLAGGVSVAKDENGRCMGAFNECGKGRAAVLGFGPENYLWITPEHEMANKLLVNLLTWLMPHGPKKRPFSNAVEVGLPRRAKILSASLNGAPVEKPAQKTIGSLKTVSLPVSSIKPGDTATIQINYEPLTPQRNVETSIFHYAFHRTFSSPAESADFLSRLGLTAVFPYVRYCGGADFFRPALPFPGEASEANACNLADYIDKHHKKGIKVMPTMKVDWVRGPKINESAPAFVDEKGVADKKKVCPLDPGVQQRNVDLVACFLEQYPQMDALMLDDNFEFQLHPCHCDQCKAKFHAYCLKAGKDEKSAAAWNEFWKEEVQAFIEKLRAVCASHGKKLGGFRELVMDKLSTEALDIPGAMGYGSPSSTARLGLLAVPGDKDYVKMLWGMSRQPDEIAYDIGEAIRAGCPYVGVWLQFKKLENGQKSDGNLGYGPANSKPDAPAIAPGTLEAVSKAFSHAEQDWLDYYRDNILGGDLRFVLLSADMKPDSLTLRIKNTGNRAEKRVMGPVKLAPISSGKAH